MVGTNELVGEFMAFKRALILGGAILLAAGCSSSVTAPIAKVDGSAANATKATSTTTTPTKRTIGTATATASDSTTCRGSYTVSSGFVDTICVIDNQ